MLECGTPQTRPREVTPALAGAIAHAQVPEGEDSLEQAVSSRPEAAYAPVLDNRPGAQPSGTPINREGSYGPQAASVRNVAESHARKRPIALYEIMQGMVDYGRKHSPPPRIRFFLTSGETIIYNGTNAPTDATQVAAVELENHGPGLSPEDAIIDFPSEEEDRLGEYGHGTTIALSYLESINAHTTIASNYGGQTWQAKTSLSRTPSRGAKLLHLEGQWGGQCLPHEQKTVFRIESPPQSLMDDFQEVPKLFLFANPNYPDAVVVPKNQNAYNQTQPPYNLDRGQVRCLRGIIPRQKEYGFVYVDGLNIPLPFYRTALPWAFHGLRDAEAEQYKMARGTDSTEIRGQVQEVVPVIVAQMTDQAALEEIITKAIRSPYFSYAELQNPRHTTLSLSPETKSAVQAVWAKLFGDTVIDTDAKRIEKSKDKLSEGTKAMKVSTDLHNFLHRAGIKTVLEATGAIGSQEIRSWDLYLPDANTREALNELAGRVKSVGGDIVIIQEGEKQYLKIQFPRIVEREEEFLNRTKHFDGQLIRMIAIVAAVQGIGCEIFSLDGNVYSQINITTDRSYPIGNYSTGITIEQYDISTLEKFMDFKTGSTYILLSGGSLRGSELRGLAQGSQRTRGGYKDQPDAPSETGSEIAYVTATSIPGSDVDADKVMRLRSRFDQCARLVPGYHPEEIGSELSFVRQGLTWTSTSQWAEVKIHSNRRERRGQATLIRKNVQGTTALSIPRGHKIESYQAVPSNARLKFFYDTASGLYQVMGEAETLEIHTRKDYTQKSPTPTVAEFKNVLRNAEASLDKHWQRLIADIKANDELRTRYKANFVADTWNDRFSRDKKSQISAPSRSACAATAVNTCKGGSHSYATGLAILLRATGISSRVVAGVDGASWSESQIWVEYHDGKEWVVLASIDKVAFKQEDVPRILITDDDPRPRTGNGVEIVDDIDPTSKFVSPAQLARLRCERLKAESERVEAQGELAKLQAAQRSSRKMLLAACVLGLGAATALALMPEVRTQIAKAFSQDTLEPAEAEVPVSKETFCETYCSE